MTRLEGGLHGLKADPSARANDEDCRHGVMLPVRPAWLTVMCGAGGRTARWAGGRLVLPAHPPCGGTDAMVPSMILSSACCTPSPETSRVIEGLSDLRLILSISSI